MKNAVQIEHRASSSRSKHEGESSFGLCDRLSRTRDNSQRQLPTDQDYAVSTREYQTDQSSLKTAPAAARSVLDERPKRRQQQTHRQRRLTRSLHIRPWPPSTTPSQLGVSLTIRRSIIPNSNPGRCQGSQASWWPNSLLNSSILVLPLAEAASAIPQSGCRWSTWAKGR